MVEFSHKRRHKQSDAVHASMCDRVQAHLATSPPISANRKVCFSFAAYARTVIAHLSKCNIPVSNGLSDEEFQQIQSKFGFDFPPDLRSILQEGLPVGIGFPNWRSSSDKQLLSMLNLPAKGLCREVSKGKFWCKHWGPRPGNIDDAVHVARKAFKMAPVLVPIYSHCYIPCFPNLSGNPILFVFEKDVFYCGYDLADFFEREVFIPLRSSSKSLRRQAWDAAVLGAARLKRQQKQQTMSSIHEELAIESMLKAGYDEEDGFLFRGHIQHHSQNRNPHHYNVGYNAESQQDHRNHLHHRSVKQAHWEMLNQRLLAELQNADANDQWTHSREGICARHNEVLARKSLSEEPLRSFECPPKSLVRSAGNSPRMGQHIMSRYAYFHEKPLPAKVLAQFTIAAPPWAAKMARHIPMWSELVENKENLHDSNVEQSDVMESRESPRDFNALQSKDSYSNVPVVHSKESSSVLNVLQSKVSPRDVHELEGKDSSREANNWPTLKNVILEEEVQGARITSGRTSKRWLLPYFKDMEKRLRRGGWKEDEIEEMMVAALPPSAEFLLHKETRGEIQDALDTSARAMSLSLRKAGWSAPDVVEILSLDTEHCPNKHTHVTR